jgi:hypothetical protein
VGSSDEDASGHSEDDDGGSDQDEVEQYSGEVAHSHGSPAASSRPRRAAAAHHHHHGTRNSPAKAAAAAAALPTRVSPRTAAAAAALTTGQAQVQAAVPQAQPGPQGAAAAWFLPPQGSGSAPAPLGGAGLRASGSAPNLMALANAGGFAASAPPPTHHPGFPGTMPMGMSFGAARAAGAPQFLGAGGAAELARAGSGSMIPNIVAGGGAPMPFGQQPAPLAPPQGGPSNVAVQPPPRPLLVRVGSETHLIPHQQQPPLAPLQPSGRTVGGTTLGKRMSRIQSEPHFPTMLGEAPRAPAHACGPCFGAATSARLAAFGKRCLIPAAQLSET